MFKKAKRCNFRRRNDSDDEEKELGHDEPSEEAQQPCGPGGDSSHTPAAETLSTAPHTLNSHGNGVQAGAVKLLKDKKKKKEARDEPKASLLSFNDEEGKTLT